MHCPKCGRALAVEALECPFCGIIISKWKDPIPAPGNQEAQPVVLPASKQTAGRWLLLAAILAAGFGGWWWCRSRPDSGRGAVAARSSGRLNPAPYRAEIEAIEGALYRSAPPNFSDAAKIGDEAERLAMRLAGSLTPRTTEARSQLNAFAASLTAASESLSYAPTARIEWTRAWEETRAAVFEPAPWFHAAAVVGPASSAADPANSLAQLRQAADSIAGLIDSARLETVDFGDEQVNLANLNLVPDGREKLERWRRWVSGWVPRVDAALAALPPPTEVPARQLDARILVERILAELKSAPDPGAGVMLSKTDPRFTALYLPDRYARETWLGNITNWLSQARRMMDTSVAGPR